MKPAPVLLPTSPSVMRFSSSAVTMKGRRESIRLMSLRMLTPESTRSVQRGRDQFGHVEHVWTRADDAFEHRGALRAADRDHVRADGARIRDADYREPGISVSGTPPPPPLPRAIVLGFSGGTQPITLCTAFAKA